LRVGLKPVAILLAAFLMASSVIAVYEYNQSTKPQKEVTAADYYTAYYNEFGIVPITNVNSSFTPPISIYHALQIGLDSLGWNKTSIQGTMVYATLETWAMYTNNTVPAGFSRGYAQNTGDVGSVPPKNYSHTYGSGVVLGYGWETEVLNSTEIPVSEGGFSGILGNCLVDAMNGQILPTLGIFA